MSTASYVERILAGLISRPKETKLSESNRVHMERCIADRERSMALHGYTIKDMVNEGRKY